ncbi:MAG: ATP phosphoribosyltransferase regulatory subunit [Candidatus Dormibacteraceae bacterium]
MQGFADLLPEEAEAMRATQEALLAEMRSWGYRYVVTPTVESLAVLERGLGVQQRRRLFKFADGDGSLLALVGERTVPVARLIAGKLRSQPLPIRLCYSGSVLVNEAGRFSRRRESHQLGAELVGAPGAVADAEVIALAVRCLDAAGLRDYQVDVGHQEFFAGLLAGLALPAQTKLDIQEALAGRDLVRLETILADTSLRTAEHELLLRFPALRGGAEILEAASGLVQNDRSAQALEDLRRVLSILDGQGLGGSVQIDLGASRDFDYYTGVVFEAYGGDLGRPVVQGGRYDHLLSGFGRPAPATGFVVHMDLVGETLQGSPARRALPSLSAAVAWSAEGLESALRLGSSLRLFGMRAVVDTQPRSLGAARRWSAGLGANHLIHVTGAAEAAWQPRAGRLRKLPPEQVVGRLAGGAR